MARNALWVVGFALAAAFGGCSCGDGDGGDGDGGALDGAVLDATGFPDGTTVLPDGATVLPDGAVVRTDGGGGGMDGALPSRDAGPYVCVVAECQGHTYQCGDCIDNDGDGLVDAQDGNCLGPCDNNEEGFDLEIPGGHASQCRWDCYFDQDEGPGNDGCTWDHRCDPLEPSAMAPPTGCECNEAPCAGGMIEVDGCCKPPDAMCPQPQSEECIDFCMPLVPRGCDCFGCCELPPRSGRTVFIGTQNSAGEFTCTIEDQEDDELCRPCTQQTSCWRECRECDLCLGRTLDDLPDHCFDGPTPMDAGPGVDGGTVEDRCDPGVQECGFPGDEPCEDGWYCLTGCCVYFG